MPKRIHTTLILVAVFVLGIAGGISVMVWAWPGLRSEFHRDRRQDFVQYLQKSLHLSASQVPPVRALFKDAGERRHRIHLEFAPAYAKVCEEYMGVRAQERQAFAPVRQQALGKLQAMLTPAQWKAFQQQRAAAEKQQANHTPDVCRHLDGHLPSGPAASRH